MEYVKYIKRQDCNWKQSSGPSGETSLNLSNEICSFLTFDLVEKGEESLVTLHIYRKDFEDAIVFIGSQMPLYRTTSKDSWETDETDNHFVGLNDSLKSFFGDSEEADYTVTIYRRHDARIYLKGLKQNDFTIRDYLVENESALKFSLSDKGIELRLFSAVSDGELI